MPISKARGSMTILLISAVMLSFGGILGAGQAAAEQISVPVPIGSYDIEYVEQGHKLSVDDFGRLLVPGKPNLPSKIFAIAIPPGAEVADVTFDLGEGIVLSGTYQIPPSPLPRVIGEENPALYERDRRMYEENYNSVYGSDQPYPASVGEVVRTAGFRKYNLVDVRVTPFSYRPQSGQLTYYPEVTVRVNYTLLKSFSPQEMIVDNLPRQERIAQEIILNYDQAQGWYPGMVGDKEDYDFVIITLDALTSSVAPLASWEVTKGRTVNVVTTSWINSNYTGYDLAERMRNFLRDKYPSGEWGIEDMKIIAGAKTQTPSISITRLT
jgi:hypothetical protein